jgi:hypothetical protein
MKERPGEKRGEPPSETRRPVHSTEREREREAPRHKKKAFKLVVVPIDQ